jgi:hypothetical protein
MIHLAVYGGEYFSKIEPIETYNIKSAVSGQVTFVNDNIKGLNASNSVIVQLDSAVDKVELEQTNKKLISISEIIKIEKDILVKFHNIRSKSQLDKDNQKIKVLNLENQKSDLIVKKASLEDRISKKSLKEKNHYISDINVKVGDFVNAGTLLYTAHDFTKGKLEIFLPISSIDNYLDKTIYIDSKATKYKIDKLYKVAHTKHISSYKCEIVIDAPKNFSTLVKIEFK